MALGAASERSRVSPLAGRHERTGKAGDASSGVAGGSAVHRDIGARRRGRQHRTHSRDYGTGIQDAVSAGATLSTHLGNGAHASLPRHPNYIWEQLAQDRPGASFIVDGHHLPGIVSPRGSARQDWNVSILVTDAVAPAMCTPGPYMLGEVEVELKDDQRVVLRRIALGGIEPAYGPRHRQCDAHCWT